MSTLREALAAEKAAFRKGPACSLEVTLSKLSADDVAELNAYLDDAAVPATAIARALQKEGHVVRAQAVQRHRSKQCRCAE